MPWYCVTVFVSLGLILSTSFSFAEQVPVDYVLCKNKKIVRTIRIEKQGSECNVIYTKAGQDRDVGGGKNFGSCEKIVENIKGNLQKAGWDCKDIAAASITEPKE